MEAMPASMLENTEEWIAFKSEELGMAGWLSDETLGVADAAEEANDESNPVAVAAGAAGWEAEAEEFEDDEEDASGTPMASIFCSIMIWLELAWVDMK